MAKVSFSKITSTKEKEIKTISINGVDVEVIQYLPMQDKGNLLLDILNSVLDANGLSSVLRETVFGALFIIKYYTNINLTEAMINNGAKTYDSLKLNGVLDAVYEAIPQEELGFVFTLIRKSLENAMTFRLSMAGMLENAGTTQAGDIKDINEITDQLKKLSESETLKDVLEKLG